MKLRLSSTSDGPSTSSPALYSFDVDYEQVLGRCSLHWTYNHVLGLAPFL